MSNKLMVVHERKVHYINLDDETVDSEDIDFDEDVEEIDISDIAAGQLEIFRLLSAIHKKQEKQDKRFDRIDMQTGATRDVLKVINKKLPDSKKDAV